MEPKKIDVPFDLDDSEKLQVFEDLKNARKERDEKLEKRRAEKRKFNQELKEIEDRIKELDQKINSGTSLRPVDCEIEYDFKNKTKKYIRIDTGDLAKEEKFSNNERRDFDSEIRKANKVLSPEKTEEEIIEEE